MQIPGCIAADRRGRAGAEVCKVTLQDLSYAAFVNDEIIQAELIFNLFVFAVTADRKNVFFFFIVDDQKGILFVQRTDQICLSIFAFPLSISETVEVIFLIIHEPGIAVSFQMEEIADQTRSFFDVS